VEKLRRVVLFAVGSPLAIDAEESCVRAGLGIAAAVRNVEGPTYVSGSVRVVAAAEVDAELRACEVVLALFTPAHRKAACEEALRLGFAGAATLVDPTTALARSAQLGRGVYVNAGCVIAGACRLGDLVLVNRGASVGHHSRLEDYASIGPGAVLCGAVTVGRGAVVGAGAVVLPEVSIGENAVVAAGSVVRESVAAKCLVGGNPCRVLKPAIRGYRDLAV
jgi:sugar O-acyltransferase (sialic acid O-acetyltransferase NeuD family)